MDVEAAAPVDVAATVPTDVVINVDAGCGCVTITVCIIGACVTMCSITVGCCVTITVCTMGAGVTTTGIVARNGSDPVGGRVGKTGDAVAERTSGNAAGGNVVIAVDINRSLVEAT